MKLKSLKSVLYSETGNLQQAVVWDADNYEDIIDGCSIDYAVKHYGNYNVKQIRAYQDKLVISITQEVGK